MSVDLDAADVIASLDTGTYAVTRRSAATYVLGRSQPGGTAPLTIDASVQPATGRDLLRLPEGRRTTETRVVYTPTPLLVGGQGTANEADLIAIDGRTWEVQLAESWPGAPGYCRAIVQVTAA